MPPQPEILKVSGRLPHGGVPAYVMYVGKAPKPTMLLQLPTRSWANLKWYPFTTHLSYTHGNPWLGLGTPWWLVLTKTT